MSGASGSRPVFIGVSRVQPRCHGHAELPGIDEHEPVARTATTSTTLDDLDDLEANNDYDGRFRKPTDGGRDGLRKLRGSWRLAV